MRLKSVNLTVQSCQPIRHLTTLKIKKAFVRLVCFNIAFKGLIVLCQSYNFTAKNIVHVYVFEITAEIVLTHHGHKFAREGHNCGTSQEGIFSIDWLLSRVSSWQPARKIIIPEKTHWHNVYTLQTLKRSEPTAF